jgi:hypothetical protein
MILGLTGKNYEMNENTAILEQIYGYQQSLDDEKRITAEDLISKRHWESERPDMICPIPGCKKVLGMLNGKYNCRRCVS